MNNFQETIIQKYDNINEKLNFLETKIIAYSFLLRNQQYNIIFTTQNIVNRCLQTGNYLRAYRYIMILEKLLTNFENNLPGYESEATNYFIKD